jgi:sulfonate transport system substrate-binding protein
VADVFEELGALTQPLKVSSFWTDDLNADLEKALAS